MSNTNKPSGNISAASRSLNRTIIFVCTLTAVVLGVLWGLGGISVIADIFSSVAIGVKNFFGGLIWDDWVDSTSDVLQGQISIMLYIINILAVIGVLYTNYVNK